jgi:hypothetical protein
MRSVPQRARTTQPTPTRASAGWEAPRAAPRLAILNRPGPDRRAAHLQRLPANVASFARLEVLPDLDRTPEDLPVQTVDFEVLPDQILGGVDVSRCERVLGLRDLRASQAAHPLDAADDVQQRDHDAQVPRDRRLPGQQREDPLVDLEVAAVNSVVVGDDHARKLYVLVEDRLERPVKLLNHEIDPV